MTSESRMSLRETRRLTPEGKAAFEQNVKNLSSKLTRQHKYIDFIINDSRIHAILDKTEALEYKKELLVHSKQYQDLSIEFSQYLQTVRCEESDLEKTSHDIIAKTVLDKVSATVMHLDSMIDTYKDEDVDKEEKQTELYQSKEQKPAIENSVIPPPMEFQEQSKKLLSRSSRSGSSRSRSSSSVIAKQKAKVAAARTRVKFAIEEADLIRKQAAIQAEIKILNVNKDVAEAECELKALNEAYSDAQSSVGSDVNPADIKQRTAEFILTHSDIQPTNNTQNFDIYSTSNIETEKHIETHVTHNSQAHQKEDQSSREAGHLSANVNIDTSLNMNSNLNANAPQFTPLNSQSNVQTTPSYTQQLDMCKVMSQYIVKRDMLLSRLSRYDDIPSHYLAWKATFKSVMGELNVSPPEEIDLLIQWLGPESSVEATDIKSVTAANPVVGLESIWVRLETKYGSPEIIARSVRQKLETFEKISNKDPNRLFKLLDIVCEIEAIKKEKVYETSFSIFDSSVGVNSIVSKLPFNIQEKWTTEASKYKLNNNMIYPPFTVFSNFLQKIAKLKNDHSFFYEETRETKVVKGVPSRQIGKQRPVYDQRVKLSCARTQTSGITVNDSNGKSDKHENKVECPLHGTNHTLNECRMFRAKSITERREFLKTKGLCFRCCGQKKHLRRDCKEQVKCTLCQSSDHSSAMHIEPEKVGNRNPSQSYEGEVKNKETKSYCTQICGQTSGIGKSCAKISLVKVYPNGKPSLAKTMYCLIDDQSNRSLASSKFFRMFKENGPEAEYTLSSCGGKVTTTGRLASNYVIESFDGCYRYNLPTLLECNDIPNNKDEIPSPNVAKNYSYLRDIAPFIPEIDDRYEIELLIGRDLVGVHHVLDDRKSRDDNLPYAQKLPLGWVIIGEVCLGKVHQPNHVSVNKTAILSNGRTSLLMPCQSEISIKNIFQTTEHDEKLGSSIEDDLFLSVMDSNFTKGPDNRWVAPLPFRDNRPVLDNNRPLAMKRARSLDLSLRSNHTKKEHVLQFMEKLLQNGHAEVAPSLPIGAECWYLPMFGVYHPRKPDSIRLVFDASAIYNEQSLNKVLLKGPDLTNNLMGILLRFRKEAIALTADVEQMFYNFKVCEEHRDYIRFIWHADNDIDKPLCDYRMTVHVFGNRPSPSVATYGLRKSVENTDSDVQDFVVNDFYVDDGLISCQDVDKAVSLIRRTQSALLNGGNLKLNKIASNSREVLDRICIDDLAKNLKDVKFETDDMPMQRSLGMAWDINIDCFTFRVSGDTKPFTKRGVLSTINGLFDPVGFTSPVSVRGKILLREMMSSLSHIGWDDTLPETYLQSWTHWVNTLPDLEQCQIPRMYSDISFSTALQKEVHIFSDASKDAIAAVAYLKLFDANHVTVSFLLGKAKVAPVHGNTIPRLELCAAVLAAEVSDLIKEHLKVHSDSMFYYTDSKVVLGYLTNETKRFHVYVGNRIRRIRSSCNVERYRHVSTGQNPADLATRGVDPIELESSLWIRGPLFLLEQSPEETIKEVHPLVNPDEDKEIRREVSVLKAVVSCVSNKLGTKRFERFSTWHALVRAIKVLKQFVNRWIRSKRSLTKTESTYDYNECDERQSECFIIREVQSEEFSDELESFKAGDRCPRNSTLVPLSPFLDKNGVFRIGGRLRNSQLNDLTKHPIIMPKKHHVSALLVRHFHDKVCHQGRHITDGAIRDGGFWIIGSRRLIYSVLQNCITCKRLRGKFGWQQMADLPEDRLTPSPPFTFVGVDTFGPWPVAFRRTRGTNTSQKRWALLFTCLVCRAIHIEVIEELSSASFINALRRFIALRGPVQQFRSDRGTNFIGASDELNMITHFVEKESVQTFLTYNRVTWIFNPPHASHMGGVWERMIGVSRKILDGILLREGSKTLTHEVLTTLLAEVTAIVNARPLIPVSTDPESPAVLSPSMLLTHKSNQSFSDNSLTEFGSKDMLKSQWKHVQVLADEFWSRWQKQYLNRLQTRQKWTDQTDNMQEGDLVLLRDRECARNNWPMAIVEKAFPSADEKVRKVQIRVVNDGRIRSYVRPICELVHLMKTV